MVKVTLQDVYGWKLKLLQFDLNSDAVKDCDIPM